MSLEEFVTVTYCFIDDTIKEKLGNLKLRKRGFEPIFSDSEVITMEENRTPGFLKWLKSTRRLVETVIGQLSDRFNIEKVRARKLWYFGMRIIRKILSHTLCILISRQYGNPSLQFERLLKL